MQRPELCRGSVEYMAPEEYMVRAPMRPSYFFVIDASPSAVQSGVTVSACEVISRTLDNIQGGDTIEVLSYFPEGFSDSDYELELII